MKELLAVILLVSGAVAEPPAPYPPSGWRPTGPSFELPQRAQSPQPQNQQYLPPVDPRNLPPQPEGDVSVQGLPQPEQRPLFQASPISGQQYAGPNFDQDLRSLDKSFQQSQYQQQQERYREYQRQKQLEAQATARPTNPRQFSRTTTEATTTPVASTSNIDLNKEEVLNEPEKEKTTVEVTKQNVQEFPGELFLSSLAQLQLQPQFVPLQTVSQPSGQYIQPGTGSQKQVAGYDGPAHFSALPSVLAQQQAQKLQQPAESFPQNQPILVQQPFSQFAQAQVQTYQPQPQVSQYPDAVVLQAPAQFQPNVYIQPNPDAVAVQPTSQYAPVQPTSQYAPAPATIASQYQPGQPQFVAQPVAFRPQPNPNSEPADENQEKEQNQAGQNQQNQFYQQPIVVQPFPAQLNQGQFYQPQNQYAQPQPGQDTQFLQPAQPQTQYLQPGQLQTQFQPQAEPQNQYPQPAAQNAQPGQFVQPQFAQPEVQYLQPQYAEPQTQYGQPLMQGQFQPQPVPQNQYLQPQFAQQGQQPLAEPQNQYLQPQFGQQQQQFGQPQQQFGQPQQQFSQPQAQFGQPQFQGQDNLQSGLDVNQEGNDIEEPEDTEDEGATAVATAFGTRTQPRVNTRYGAPYPVPKVQASPGTTTESAVEDITEEGPAVAQAVAVANGERRKSARLRGRRIRPVYAVDQSGRLVLAEA